jgi:hypothetical protein
VSEIVWRGVRAPMVRDQVDARTEIPHEARCCPLCEMVQIDCDAVERPL